MSAFLCGERMSRVSSENSAARSATILWSWFRTRGLPSAAASGFCKTFSISATSEPNASATSRLPSLSASLICFWKSRRSSSERLICRANFSVAVTMPSTPDGTSSESFLTSSPARPKIAWSSFSSGVSSVLLFGETFPTRISPGRT